MKATIRHYLELAAQWLIGWLMDQFLADPIAHLEDALKQLAEAKGGGAQVDGARSVTRRSPDEVAGERLALAIAFVLASIVFLAGFIVGRVV